jgi:hypothetical protein
MATQSETFDTANSDTLGPVLSWTEESGDIDIVSNRARVIDIGDNHARARAPALDTANHYAQAVVRSNAATGQCAMGVMLRKNSATGTKTYYLIDLDFDGDECRFWKCETGSFTPLGTFASTAAVADTDYTVYGSINGSAIEAKVDGVSKFTTSDSAITGNLHAGIHFAFGVLGVSFFEIDNYTAADIELPPGPTTAPSLNNWIGGYW